MTVAAPGSDTPPAGPARLILQPDDPLVRTAVQDLDVRGSLTRGVADLLEQVSADAAGGRQLKFKRVLREWAEPEENAKYPSVVVYTTGPGTYDASGFTPNVDPNCRIPPPDGRYLVTPAEYVQDLTVEIWATDKNERAGLVFMCERAFNPVTWRYGFVMELPYYFSQRATYALKDLTYEDSEEDAMRRYRKASFTLSASAPLVYLVKFPDAKPRFELAAIGTGSDVLVSTTVS